MRIKFIWLAVLFGLIFGFATAQSKDLNPPAARPNIVLIFTDKLGYGN